MHAVTTFTWMHNEFKPSLKKFGRLKMKNAEIFLKFSYLPFALLFFLYPHSSLALGRQGEFPPVRKHQARRLQ
jgi:hypothetical protein